MKNHLFTADSVFFKSAVKSTLVLLVLSLTSCLEPIPPVLTAQWAHTVSTGSSSSNFYSTAVDSSGNVYAAGRIIGTGTYTFGTGVAVTGASTSNNVELVKYNASGTAQWARTVSTGIYSEFSSVAVDSSGNTYAAGVIFGTGIYTFGTGVTAAGTSTDMTVVLVKYNATGVVQWARTVSTGDSYSGFSSVAVDSSGNVYATGYIGGTGTYTFGTGVTAAGTSSGYNVVLVKYNSAGTAQWARTVSTGSSSSQFYSAAVDSSGNVYAAGYIGGTGTYTFDTGVTAEGSSSGDNVVLVKYNASGVSQWSRTVSTGSLGSLFHGVAVDASGNVYAAGRIDGTGTYTFGTGITAAGTYTGSNVVLVKYNASGVSQWSRTVSTGSYHSGFSGVAADTSGNVYAAGMICGTGTFTFGPGVTAAGAADAYNVILVKYYQ